MYTKAGLTVCLTTLIIAGSMSANASVVYDNGAPDYSGEVISDAAYYYYTEHVDDFVLPTGIDAITDVHWWGLYLPNNTPTTDNFTIRIFANESGAPDGSALYDIAVTDAHRTDVGMDDNGNELYSYSAYFSPISLTTGTTYWLSIQNNTSGDNNNFWWWATAGAGDEQVRFSDSGPWYANTQAALAFNLTNDNVVPEPASLTLLSLGMAGLVGRRFRQRANP